MERGNLDRKEDIHVYEAGINIKRLILEGKNHLLGGRRLFLQSFNILQIENNCAIKSCSCSELIHMVIMIFMIIMVIRANYILAIRA